jgi:REP element-mobilizing transposase RayT
MRVSPHPDRNRRLPRLKDFDYSKDGAYFITICTANRENIFGKIRDDKMILNESGQVAEKCWREAAEHFPDLKSDEFVVMPNHLHGIVWIGNEVGNRHACSSNKKSNLSTIIGSFKSAATKIIRQQNSDVYLLWQKSFYDRVIRDNEELNRIRDYIWQNPQNWENDEENLEC